MSVQGFDYRTQQACTRPAGEWSADLARVIAAGGRRRVEHGETFAHDARGLIVFEVYGNVRPAKL